MSSSRSDGRRAARALPWLIWGAVASLLVIPLILAAQSPLLAWRDGIYIAASFAGILAMGLFSVQPLGIAALLPGVSPTRARLMHKGLGALICLAVLVHVGGLWITSPPDVVDALLFVSPTSFSVWGVLAMWAVFLSGGMAVFRRKWRISPKTWRRFHLPLMGIAAGGTIVHALLITGLLSTPIKAAISLGVLVSWVPLAPLIRRSLKA